MAYSTRRPRRRSRVRCDDGQAAVELALVLPLLAVFTLLIAQFAVVARDQLAVWQLARETARTVALSADPDTTSASLRATLPGDSSITIVDSTVVVTVAEDRHLSVVGFGIVTPTATLRARVVMALEPMG